MTPDNRVRLQKFKSLTIAHPSFQAGIDVIMHALTMTEIGGGPPISPMLLGESGTGKTKICDVIYHMLGKPTELVTDDEIITTKPVIYCTVPENATIKKLVQELLRSFGEVRLNQNLAFLEHRLYALLRTSRTRLVILDEWQHLIQRGADKTRQSVCDWVKVFGEKEFKGVILLVGIPDSECVVDQHDQLPRRYPYRIKLRNFSLYSESDNDNFEKLVKSFSKEIITSMNFSTSPSFNSEELLIYLYAFSSGNIDALHTLLNEALSLALERNDADLLLEDIKQAADLVHSKHCITKTNPFRESTKYLKERILRATR